MAIIFISISLFKLKNYNTQISFVYRLIEKCYFFVTKNYALPKTGCILKKVYKKRKLNTEVGTAFSDRQTGRLVVGNNIPGAEQNIFDVSMHSCS